MLEKKKKRKNHDHQLWRYPGGILIYEHSQMLKNLPWVLDPFTALGTPNATGAAWGSRQTAPADDEQRSTLASLLG